MLGAKTGCFDTRTKWLTNKGISKQSKEKYLYLQDGGIVLKPNATELLYGLILDSDSASETFEDFCDTLGFDEDSRKALELYLECQKVGGKLNKVLGYSLINLLREALEDY
jgi:hypothetical protein